MLKNWISFATAGLGMKADSMLEMKQGSVSPKLRKYALEWYKELSINHKISLKEVCYDLCGLKWEDFNILFLPTESLVIVFEKLIIERII